jgi:predicted DNA-binding protein with PD1-like motif
MRYCEAKQGRTFVLRLTDGEVVHEVIEGFAKENGITAAALLVLGGAREDSRLVVGPETSEGRPVNPMTHVLTDVHEVTGTGTLFLDDTGAPLLHMHMACGRKDRAVAGCIRSGVRVWQVMEVVLWELVDTAARRVMDAETGFKLLQP